MWNKDFRRYVLDISNHLCSESALSGFLLAITHWDHVGKWNLPVFLAWDLMSVHW